MRASVPINRVPTQVRVHPLWTPLALFVIAIGTRLPGQSRLLYHWDSVNFAFALDRFDIAIGQPHAPGYLLYVLLGRIAFWVTGDAQAALVASATLSSALAVVALYDLGRRVWDARVGLLAALLLLTSPLFWFYGEIALPHALDALMVLVAATLSWRVWHGERRIAFALAIWLGVAGGLRQQTLVFMFPLAFVAAIRLPWRYLLGSAALLAITILLWIVPLFALTGGPARYFAIVGAYSAAFDRPTSVLLGAGWAGLQYNLDKLIRYTIWGWALGIVPAVAGAWLLGSSIRRSVRDVRVWLIGFWIAPCLLFYTLIHMGQQGLIFVYLPALLLLSARGGIAIVDRWRGGNAILGACVLGNALLFLLLPSHLLGDRVKVLSQATIREQDALLAGQIAAVGSDLPTGAVLLAEEWRFPQFYLPDVPLVRYGHSAEDARTISTFGAADQQLVLSAQVLAWYEPTIDRFNRAGEHTVLGSDHNGVRLRVLRRGADERFWMDASGFGIERRAP
jgi:4-amino-4-deoxy-L-arabinose transferase-like glycosyltransferase